jgi:thiamine-phosphate pyrophosphorylase
MRVNFYHTADGDWVRGRGTRSYTEGVIRYAITDATFTADDAARWVAEGVDFVQLREKEMDAGALVESARRLVRALGAGPGLLRGGPKLLMNGRADVAIAAGAAGVHLTAREGELTPGQVREVFAEAGMGRPVVSVSCHTLAEVGRAGDADWILFGPVFEKRVAGVVVVEGVGMEALREACAIAPGRVLALGGVDAENAAECVKAGAAGVAGIRLFQ